MSKPMILSERVEIIANDQGNRTTPSCVAFTPEEKLVGEAAHNQAVYNVTSTVFGIKCMIGRRYCNPQLQSDMKHWPFRVQDKGGKPVIVVTFKGETKQFTAEQISTMILVKMKQTAELKLGAVKDVTSAYWSADCQKQTNHSRCS
ncbi:Hsp70 chaperone [Entomophthora muscae]|uniref:Hsp70 chaperone n=1 Tax=Entomophthora muscae TaxID=34485 RepID=A0ACC2SX32_9FUNG|nr:Hsp70 chaperone [Entomophthora muscae]